MRLITRQESIYNMEINREYLERFIMREEISKFNPMYYLYYPAKSSVNASKIQLKAVISGIKELNQS